MAELDELRLAVGAYGHKLRRIVVEAKPEAARAQLDRAAFYERAWREAATALGATVEAVGNGVLDIERGAHCVRVCANESPLDNGVTLRVAGDKPLVHQILLRRGVPVPRHVACTAKTIAAAFRFGADLATPAVVKPAFGTGGGVGVTTNVSGRYAMLKALAWARSYCATMLVEEQIEGEIYRLLFLDGVLLDCVVRRAPHVVGNGRSNIAELVQAENRRRSAEGVALAQGQLWMDEDLRRELARQGLTPRAVPDAGMRIRVKRAINDNRGEDNETAELCPAIVETAMRATQAVGARLAGVDVMTADPSRPLEATGGVVIEINTTPGFYYHYYKRDGCVPVAQHVLERAFADAAR